MRTRVPAGDVRPRLVVAITWGSFSFKRSSGEGAYPRGGAQGALPEASSCGRAGVWLTYKRSSRTRPPRPGLRWPPRVRVRRASRRAGACVYI